MSLNFTYFRQRPVLRFQQAGLSVGKLVSKFTALILFLAASTSYAGFPRLSSLLAQDRYALRQLASISDRLVFSIGFIGLTFAAIILVIMFGGQTHHLIPSYAVGIFISFTRSQEGMVMHHYSLR